MSLFSSVQSQCALPLTDVTMPLGEDGPSQMALEDLAMFRAIPTCTVFYPSDGVSTERAVELSANTKVSRPIVCPVSCLHTDGIAPLLWFNSSLFILRVSVSSVPVDQTLQSSTLQMRSLKWA